MLSHPIRYALLLIGLSLSLPHLATAGEWSVSGRVGLEYRYFADAPAYPGQHEQGQASLVLEPEFDWVSENRRTLFRIVPFARLDSLDDERTHYDLREGYGEFLFDEWELLVGAGKVFWGVTESRHLVDIVNQTDAVEDIDDEDKLGQPMIRLATQRSWGRLELFGLVGFRKRTFPGPDGRLRPPLAVDGSAAQYESGAGSGRIDLAVRWSHYFGDWDVGASWFHGTSREARFLEAADGQSLVPFYDVIGQFGVDVQYTRNAWLWKLEAFGRRGHGDTFGAAVAGFEYTFYQVGRGAADVGLLAEYLHDDRGPEAPFTVFDDDLFVGSRLAFNDSQDTQILVGAVIDSHDGSIAGRFEAERRLGTNYTLAIEARWFSNVDRTNVLALFEQDSFLSVGFARHF